MNILKNCCRLLKRHQTGTGFPVSYYCNALQSLQDFIQTFFYKQNFRSPESFNFKAGSFFRSNHVKWFLKIVYPARHFGKSLKISTMEFILETFEGDSLQIFQERTQS